MSDLYEELEATNDEISRLRHQRDRLLGASKAAWAALVYLGHRDTKECLQLEAAIAAANERQSPAGARRVTPDSAVTTRGQRWAVDTARLLWAVGAAAAGLAIGLGIVALLRMLAK